jgi:hypothetical protein
MEEQKPHINIIFLTPGHSLMSSYVKSLFKTINVLQEKGITWGFSSEYSSHVGDAREVTLNGDNNNTISESRPFKGEVTYDKLMWIDSDINWEPEDVLRLYESDKDIISGAYMLGSGEVVAYKELFGRAYTYDEIKDATELMKVHSVGFGFVCIKQGVFEKMTRPWFQSVLGTTKQNGEEFTFPILGEDLSFCQRANNLGFEVWLDPNVKLIHNKMMKLTWGGIVP